MPPDPVRYKRLSPCIGIPTWGVIHGRSGLLPEAETGRAEAARLSADWEEEDEGTADGGAAAAKKLKAPEEAVGTTANPYLYKGGKMEGESPVGTKLDSNHSHYVLVDDGSNGAFGREINFRSELEVCPPPRALKEHGASPCPPLSSKPWQCRLVSSALQDFISFRRDESTAKLDDLAEEIRNQTADTPRSVPYRTTKEMMVQPLS